MVAIYVFNAFQRISIHFFSWGAIQFIAPSAWNPNEKSAFTSMLRTSAGFVSLDVSLQSNQQQKMKKKSKLR
jgi:uncharacterized membrane protein